VSFVSSSKPIPEDSIVLISGSLPYLINQSMSVSGNCLLLLDEPFRSKQTPSSTIVAWKRFRHRTFGGSTSYIALVGFVGESKTPEQSGLTRTIAHVIEYSVPPGPNLEIDAECYTLDDFLHPDALDRPVRYPTHRSSTGWAVRHLTCDELAVAFGLPAVIRKVLTSSHVFPIVPIQILDACIRSVTSLSPGEPHFVAPTPYVVPDIPTSTWLPTLKMMLPHSWIDQDMVTDKAAKRDDAEVHITLWDRRITLVLPLAAPLLPLLRLFLHQYTRHRLAREFMSYLMKEYGPTWRVKLSCQWGKRPLKRQKGGLGGCKSVSDGELAKDFSIGTALLRQWAQSSWWAWNKGSTLIFWRWPSGSQRLAARDGMVPYIQDRLPVFLRGTKAPKPAVFELILPKLQKLVDRGYVKYSPEDPHSVKSLIDYFHVPKADDIRLVLNGTSCGLNAAVWAPNFWLPTSKTAANLLNYNYCSVDVDLGEMFYNFPLPEVFRKYSGVDLTPYNQRLKLGNNKAEQATHVRWERCWMGFRPCPYYAVRFYYWTEELVRGDRKARDNPLRWDRIRMNLLGSFKFDPTLPRVMKWCDQVNNLAGDLLAFIDDLRCSGMSEEHAWQVARRVASVLQHLGVQDAPRKRKPSVRETGAWAGTMFSTLKGKIEKFVSQAKWNKGRDIIAALWSLLSGDSEDILLNYKKLEQDVGFLCHLSMTYDRITPYLKGIYLTLSDHLPKRDEEGWKKTDKQWAAYVYQKVSEGSLSNDQAAGALRPPEFASIPVPTDVKPVSRLASDIKALMKLFELTTPPRTCVRAALFYSLKYGFVDASGCGVGATITTPEGIRLREGTWGTDSEDESSNWREYTNLVEFLEEQAALGNLREATVVICTDNSVAESAANRGTSSSKKLFDLTLRLHALEMKYSLKLIISHVSGERMKAQGTDGTSRGHHKEGVSLGHNMLSYIPFDETAFERSQSLKPWVQSWATPKAEFLEPEDWFERGHDIKGGGLNDYGMYVPTIVCGTFIWSPPPAAADVALEQLRQARIKRQDSCHIFICPRLLTCEWIKQLYKAADLVFEVPTGYEGWPTDMFEPLTIGILFPFVPHRPWQLRSTPKMFYVARELRRLFEEENLAAGDFLRQFLVDCKRLQSMSKDVVWKMLHFRSRSEVPRSDSCGRGRPKRDRSISQGEVSQSVGRKASIPK